MCLLYFNSDWEFFDRAQGNMGHILAGGGRAMAYESIYLSNLFSPPPLDFVKHDSAPLIITGQGRQACLPLIQLFFGFASDIDQTNINRDIRDGNWLSRKAL